MRPKLDDLTYLRQRAEQELEAAQEASHPAAVRAHYQLASLYLENLDSDGVSDEPRGTPPLDGAGTVLEIGQRISRGKSTT